MMKRIYLYGYYGFGNVGDDLLLKSMLNFLDSRFPDTELIVRSLAPASVARKHGKLTYQCGEATLYVNCSKFERLRHYLRLQWDAMKCCDHIIFGGGTLFHAQNGNSTNLMLIVLIVLIGRLRGSKVHAVGVGVGELSTRLSRVLFSGIVRFSELFLVRDVTSLDHCQRFLYFGSVTRTADLVFTLPVYPSSVVKSDRGVHLGITLALIGVNADSANHSPFVEGFRAALNHWRGQGWSVTFLVFQDLHAESVTLSDRDSFHQVFGEQEGIESLRVSSDLTVLEKQFAGFDCIVGMRYHSLVIASLLGIPFVGLGNDHKVADLCDSLSMPVLPLQGFGASELLMAVSRTVERAPDPMRVQSLRQAAWDNFSQLASAMGC